MAFISTSSTSDSARVSGSTSEGYKFASNAAECSGWTNSEVCPVISLVILCASG